MVKITLDWFGLGRDFYNQSPLVNLEVLLIITYLSVFIAQIGGALGGQTYAKWRKRLEGKLKLSFQSLESFKLEK